MCGGERFHFAGVASGVFLQTQQGSDLLQGEADGACVTDEMQTSEVGAVVTAIASGAARGGREQTIFKFSEETLPLYPSLKG